MPWRSTFNKGFWSLARGCPTHRDLARELGVTVGTVSRAYAQAKRRGLVTGEVGRGLSFSSRVRTKGQNSTFPSGRTPTLSTSA